MQTQVEEEEKENDRVKLDDTKDLYSQSYNQWKLQRKWLKKINKIDIVLIEDETPTNNMPNVTLDVKYIENIVSFEIVQGEQSPKSIKDTLMDTSNQVIV